MEIVGRATIHPAVFYSGKVCGYLTWALLVLDLFGVRPFGGLHTSLDLSRMPSEAPLKADAGPLAP